MLSPAISYIIKSINILIYPYIFSYIRKEITRIGQYKIDLEICEKNNITDVKKKEIDDKTAIFYKKNTLIYYLSIILVFILCFQGFILLWQINRSFSQYRLSHSIISILCIGSQLLVSALILSYFYSDNNKISESFDDLNITQSLKNIGFWTYIFNICIIANIGYTLIYNMNFFINIEKRI
jgi:hypothetical protein